MKPFQADDWDLPTRQTGGFDEGGEDHTGSAAALIPFSVTLMGAVGIQIVTFNSPDLIQNCGVSMVVIGATCAILWLFVRHRPFVSENVTHLMSRQSRITLKNHRFGKWRVGDGRGGGKVTPNLSTVAAIPGR